MKFLSWLVYSSLGYGPISSPRTKSNICWWLGPKFCSSAFCRCTHFWMDCS